MVPRIWSKHNRIPVSYWDQLKVCNGVVRKRYATLQKDRHIRSSRSAVWGSSRNNRASQRREHSCTFDWMKGTTNESLPIGAPRSVKPSTCMGTCAGKLLVGSGWGDQAIHLDRLRCNPTLADVSCMRPSAFRSSEAGPTKTPSSMYQNCAMDGRACSARMMD